MAKYRVWIEEILSSPVDVEAEDAGEAILKVRRRYRNKELVPTAENFACTEFNVEKLEESEQSA